MLFFASFTKPSSNNLVSPPLIYNGGNKYQCLQRCSVSPAYYPGQGESPEEKAQVVLEMAEPQNSSRNLCVCLSLALSIPFSSSYSFHIHSFSPPKADRKDIQREGFPNNQSSRAIALEGCSRLPQNLQWNFTGTSTKDFKEKSQHLSTELG